MSAALGAKSWGGCSLRTDRGQRVGFRSPLWTSELSYPVDSFAVFSGGTAGHDGETLALAEILRPGGLDYECTHRAGIALGRSSGADRNLGLVIHVARVPGYG